MCVCVCIYIYIVTDESVGSNLTMFINITVLQSKELKDLVTERE
jgi:hypothetical protein